MTNCKECGAKMYKQMQSTLITQPVRTTYWACNKCMIAVRQKEKLEPKSVTNVGAKTYYSWG